MSDQLYRLEKRYRSDEWPKCLNDDAIDSLNQVAPSSYHYTLSFSDGETYVELYEYMGEADA